MNASTPSHLANPTANGTRWTDTGLDPRPLLMSKSGLLNSLLVGGNWFQHPRSPSTWPRSVGSRGIPSATKRRFRSTKGIYLVTRRWPVEWARHTWSEDGYTECDRNAVDSENIPPWDSETLVSAVSTWVQQTLFVGVVAAVEVVVLSC